MKSRPEKYHPDSATVDALCRLVCAYLDLKVPMPDELIFMLPDDGEGISKNARRTAGCRRIPRVS